MGSVEFFLTHPVFTLEEYSAHRAVAGSSHPRTIETLLADHVRSGRIVRVRRGLYASVPPGILPQDCRPDVFLVAGRLAPDAVVAYHAALQFRGVSYSVWDKVQVATQDRRRPFSFQGTAFVPIQLPATIRDREDQGGGIVTESRAGGTVRVTSFERTLVDVLDNPVHGGGWEEVWRSLEMVEYFELDEVVQLTLLRQSALTAARVGFFLERHRDGLMVEEQHLAPLRAHRPRQPLHLDRQRESGRFIRDWNLVVPERVLTRAWEEPL